MKIKVIFILLSAISSLVMAQQLDYGLYIRHEQLSEYDALYEFFFDSKTFTYCTDAYNNLTGRVCMKGRFSIEGDSIFFYDIILSVPILSDLTRISPKDLGRKWIPMDTMLSRPTSSNYWSLTGNDCRGSLQEIKPSTQKRFSATFFRHENDDYIEIDGERFYMDPGDNGVYEEAD